MRPRVDRHLVRRQDGPLLVAGVDPQGVGPGRRSDIDLDLVGRPPLPDPFASVEREGQVVDARARGVGADPDPPGDQALRQRVDADAVVVGRVAEARARRVRLGEPVEDAARDLCRCAGLPARIVRDVAKRRARDLCRCAGLPARIVRDVAKRRARDLCRCAGLLARIGRDVAKRRARVPSLPHQRHVDVGAGAEEPAGLLLPHLDDEPVGAGTQVALGDERNRRARLAVAGSRRPVEAVAEALEQLAPAQHLAVEHEAPRPVARRRQVGRGSIPTIACTTVRPPRRPG